MKTQLLVNAVIRWRRKSKLKDLMPGWFSREIDDSIIMQVNEFFMSAGSDHRIARKKGTIVACRKCPAQ